MTFRQMNYLSAIMSSASHNQHGHVVLCKFSQKLAATARESHPEVNLWLKCPGPLGSLHPLIPLRISNCIVSTERAIVNTLVPSPLHRTASTRCSCSHGIHFPRNHAIIRVRFGPAKVKESRGGCLCLRAKDKLRPWLVPQGRSWDLPSDKTTSFHASQATERPV
jgi:hypothetical protein